MSAPQFTPGPWQRSGVRVKLGEHDCLAVGPDGFSIAFLPIGRRPNEQAGAIADARLIAAAPELLAAIELALPIIEDEREVTVDSNTILYKGNPDFGKDTDPDAVELIQKYDAALNAGRAALAKARGEQ